MSVVPRPATLRVLVLCDDPMEAQLLRSLLRALPHPRTDIYVHDATDGPIPQDVASFDCCFLGFGYAGSAPAAIAGLLRNAAPTLRVIGTLSAEQRYGDRMELVDALRAGVSDFVDVAELSVSMLKALLRPESAAPPRLPSPAIADLPAVPGRDPGGSVAKPSVEFEPPERSVSGAWHIVLGEQRAGFDAETCRRLGYAPAELGDGIGDWKSLIHPDDVDRLVQELHRVLDGSAPPHPVNYRIKSRDAGWLQVVSDDISVELDESGAPRAITGHFYSAGAETRLPAGITPPATPEPRCDTTVPAADILGNCTTGVIVYVHDAQTDTFRIRYCNPAAADIEGRDLDALVGARARAVSPQFDAFELEEALGRVADTGIPETHEVMVIARGGEPRWRRYRMTRLPDDSVLCETEDVSDQVNARLGKRDEDELAQYLTRSYPVTTLLLDEHGRIVACVSSADAFGASGKSTIRELLGEQGGHECVQQLNRTLNTGRPGTATYCVESEGGRQWLECHSAPLRGRPGTPQRVVLTLLDVSERQRQIEKLEAASQHLRGALRRIPMPIYLKDLDGRYQIVNPAFEDLFGVEESMLLGKTDFEIFPDELAAELHEDDLRIIERRETFSGMRTLGQGDRRERYQCWCFPVGGRDERIIGTGGIWIAPAALPASGARAASAPADHADASRDERDDELAGATASVIGRVEDALAEAGNYADVLRQLEQLVETTMQAQALIHQVAGQTDPPHPRALVALAPLAQDIVELERILVPRPARLENDIESTLPPAQCDPVVFHQILLRGIRHARRSLGPAGSIGIRLRRTTPGRRPCLSCKDGFEGSYVELIIEDSDSSLSDEDIRDLTAGGEPHEEKSSLQDLIAIHALAHGQGGHLQIQKNLPTGTSLHVFFKAGDPVENGEAPERRRSTVASFPLGRIWGNKNPP